MSHGMQEDVGAHKYRILDMGRYITILSLCNRNEVYKIFYVPLLFACFSSFYYHNKGV